MPRTPRAPAVRAIVYEFDFDSGNPGAYEARIALHPRTLRQLRYREGNMDLPTYFTDFLKNISPSPVERKEYQQRHQELRERLLADEDLKDVIVTTFLQGSYRRATLLRPGPDEHADVDVVVVTKISKEDTTPDAAMRAFVPFWSIIIRASTGSKAALSELPWIASTST